MSVPSNLPIKHSHAHVQTVTYNTERRHVGDKCEKITATAAVVTEGKAKSRLNLLKSNAEDLRFNVACKRAADMTGLNKLTYIFTHVKMSVNGEDIYINKRSVANRLGLTIDQVKRVAAANDIAKFEAMAEKRKEIYEFFHRFRGRMLDSRNSTDRMYFVLKRVFWRGNTAAWNSRCYRGLKKRDIRLKVFSQYEFIKMDNYNGKPQIFKVDRNKFMVGTVKKPETNLQGYIPLDDNVIFVSLYPGHSYYTSKWDNYIRIDHLGPSDPLHFYKQIAPRTMKGWYNYSGTNYFYKNGTSRFKNLQDVTPPVAAAFNPWTHARQSAPPPPPPPQKRKSQIRKEKWQDFVNTHRKNIVRDNGTDAYAKLKRVILDGQPTYETVLFGSHRTSFTRAEINKANRELSRIAHPDRNRERAREAEVMFKVVTEAKSQLEAKLERREAKPKRKGVSA